MSTRPPWEDYQAIATERPPWEDYASGVVVEEESPLKKLIRQIVQAKVHPLVTAALPGGAVIRNPVTGEGSIEQGLENLPATGAVALTPAGVPGMALGAAGGEGYRQVARRAVGLPASTGLVQRALNLKPESLGAAVAGMGTEAAVTPVAQGASNLIGAGAKWAKDSGLRSLVNLILHPQGKRLQNEGMGLAQVMRDEGLVPTTGEYFKDLLKSPFKGTVPSVARTTRSNLAGNSNELLHGANRELAAEKAAAVGSEVPYGGVLKEAAEAVPPPLVGGGTPGMGEAQRESRIVALEDAIKEVSNYPTGKVPADVAVSIKERWNQMLDPFYESTALNARESLRSTQTVADAWTKAIHNALPNLGKKLTRDHNLITITDMLRDAAEKSRRLGELRPGNEGMIRFTEHIPILKWFRSIHNSAQWASLSAAGKDTLASILKEGNTGIQAWLRVADQFNVPQASETPGEVRPEEKGLKELAQSILEKRGNPPSVSEEEFIRRYQ